jgi:hypothetical protein
MRRALPREAIAPLPALAAALALALGGAPTAAGAAEPSSVSAEASAREGAVRAVLTYREGLGRPLPYFDLKLSIARSGTSFYEQPVSSRDCPSGCEPLTLGNDSSQLSPLAVADLEANAQPNVVLELSSGGAHCCSVVQVFTYDPGTMTYGVAEHDFGDPGARLTELEGGVSPVFESADDRFAYKFAPYAYSGLPLQVWRFREGRFTNVTSGFPRAIAADAAVQLKGFMQTRREGNGLGLIAAWAADEYMLGHRALVARTLARELRHGRLRSKEHYAPSGAAFISSLNRFLKHSGYA